MKSFVFELKVPEGNDEFWESLHEMSFDNAAESVKELIEEALRDYAIDGVELKFKQLTYEA